MLYSMTGVPVTWQQHQYGVICLLTALIPVYTFLSGHTMPDVPNEVHLIRYMFALHAIAYAFHLLWIALSWPAKRW